MSNNITYNDFKTLLDSNVSGLTEDQIKQAFVFRRVNIFVDESNDFSKLDRMLAFPNVITVENVNPAADYIPNLSLSSILSRPASRSFVDGSSPEAPVDRNGMYSRVEWPVSSKNNWSKLSNNFNIYKRMVETNKDEKTHYVKFPKYVKDNDLNTVISFKGIDVDFEGTYIDTARSDVVVKIRFTLDNFTLLENYYDSDGKLITDTPPDFGINKFYKNYVRFLDLLTPPEIQKEQNFTTKGIVLEMYTNNTDEPSSHVDLSENKLNQISYNNALQLSLYLVDHSMSFDEITNKVDVEIEYRAAADIPLINKNPQNNILYAREDTVKLAALLEKRRDLLKNNCYAIAKATSDEIAKIEKVSFKERVKIAEDEKDGLGYTVDGTPVLTKYRVKKYPYSTSEEFEDEKDGEFTEGVFQGYSGLNSYGENLFPVPPQDMRISQDLQEAKYPSQSLGDHFLSLHSLLTILFPTNSEGTELFNQVILPYIPLAGVTDQNAFSLGDLPINAKSFDDWFQKKYINSNLYYLEYKTLVKDILLNYVNPHLRYAWSELSSKPQISVSIKEMVGENAIIDNINDPSRTLTGNQFYASDLDFVKFFPSKNLIENRDSAWNMIIVNIDSGGDFQPRIPLEGENILNTLTEISKSFMVIEAKSPYGPFKNLKLSKNDSGYLREIRSIEQEVADIGQLGAVYDATLETYPNCPDFRFFPGEMCYLYIPEFGLSTDTGNLAYKLGIGGNQIITKVSHKIELEGTAKMTTSIVMRYWSSGVSMDHTNTIDSSECIVPEEATEDFRPPYVPSPGDFGTLTPEQNKEFVDNYIVPLIEIFTGKKE